MSDSSSIHCNDIFINAINNSPHILFKWKMDEGWPVDYVSENVRLLGYSQQEMTEDAFRFSNLIYHADLERVLKEVQYNIKNQIDRFRQEYRIKDKYGNVFWMDDWTVVHRDDNGQILYITGILSDITARKDSELLNSQLAAIVTSSDDAIISLDHSGTIQSWNTGANRIFGFEAEEVIGKYYRLYIPEEFRPEFESIIKRIISGQKVNDIETVIKNKYDHEVHVLLSLSSIRYPDNNKIGISLIIRDISEKKKREILLLKFKFGIERSDEAIFITDNKGEFEYINPAFEKIFGFGWKDVQGKTPRLLKSGMNEPSIYRSMWNSLREGKVFKSEMINKNASENHIHVYVSINPIVDEQNNVLGFLAIERDISERIQAEKKLKENEERFRKMFHDHSAIMLLIDHSEGSIVIDANTSAIRFYGYSKKELIGMNMHRINILPPEEIKQRVDESKKRKENYFIFPHRLADGTIRDVEVHSSPVKINGRKVSFSIIHDITDRIAAEKALKESEERWHFAIEGNRDGLWDWYPVINKVYFSPNLKRMLEYEENEIENNMEEWTKRIHPDDYDRVLDAMQRHLSGETPFYQSEHRVQCKDGTYKWILDRGKVVRRDEDGNPLRVIGTHTDITEKKNWEHELERLSMTDTMTNIFNRKRLYQALESEIDRARRYREFFSLIMFDIDHFKLINDTYGHDVGDQVIISIVEIVNELIRMSDIFARWGGEEFMILAPQTKLKGATQLAERIRKKIDDKSFETAGQVTASFGVARLRRGEDQDEILKRVDEALYLAKNNGRNLVVNLGEDVEI